MANVEQIAKASRRIEAMSFGVADYAASTRARTTVIGGVHHESVVLADAKKGMKLGKYFGLIPGMLHRQG